MPAVAAIEGFRPPNVAWMPLKLESALANTDDDIARNIKHALSLEYLSFQQLVGTKQGAVAVVGSGPSLKANWRKLRAFKGDIIACNAACQFLLGKGITPRYMFCFDADPLMLEFMTPHPEITYLLASRCPPKAFDLIKGCKLSVWHAGGDTEIEKLLQDAGKFTEPMVSGGTAAITRCMVLAQAMGYKTIHLWGADSSFANGDTHIRQSTTVERRMFVNVAGREFETAPWMARQVEDFKLLAPRYRDLFGTRFFVHGDGLMQQVAASLDFDVDWPLARKQFFRKWKWNLVNLYRSL